MRLPLLGLCAVLAFCQPALADQKNWDKCIASVLLWEGGWTGLRPQEPGGYAMRGVSYQVFKEWRKKQGKPEPTPEDLHNISVDETKQIYAELYAKRIKFAELASGYDCAMMHGAVMFGPGEGTEERPGMTRLDRVAKGDYSKLVILMLRAKMLRPDCGPSLNQATGKPMWLCKGWANRLVAVYNVAHGLAGR
jgi:hypothetical protein